MKVTIQDVLKAGDEIFGLPCRHSECGEGFCESPRTMDGEVRFSFKKEVCASGGDYHWINAADLTIRADGVRVLDINGRLYRVTGHAVYDEGYVYKGTKHSAVIGGTALVEPLIPDKPKQPDKCDDCAHEFEAKRCDKCGAELEAKHNG